MIERAADQLQEYIARQTRRAAAVAQALKQIRGLNKRQEVVLERALRQPDAEFTVAGHQIEYRVSYGSARSDLNDLVGRGLLVRSCTGKKFVFRPAPNLADRLGGGAR